MATMILKRIANVFSPCHKPLKMNDGLCMLRKNSGMAHFLKGHDFSRAVNA